MHWNSLYKTHVPVSYCTITKVCTRCATGIHDVCMHECLHHKVSVGYHSVSVRDMNTYDTPCTMNDNGTVQYNYARVLYKLSIQMHFYHLLLSVLQSKNAVSAFQMTKKLLSFTLEDSCWIYHIKHYVYTTFYHGSGLIWHWTLNRSIYYVWYLHILRFYFVRQDCLRNIASYLQAWFRDLHSTQWVVSLRYCGNEFSIRKI